MRVWRGAAVSVGRDLGRGRHQLRALLRERHRRRALLFDADGRRAARHRRASAPTTSGMPTCRTSRRASSTATGSHGPYEPAAGHRFNPQAAARPLRQARSPARSTGPRCAATGRARRRRPRLTPDDSAPAPCRSVVVDPPSTGATTAAAHPLGGDGHLRGPRQGLHQRSSRRARRSCAARTRARLRRRPSSTCSGWASRPSSCCRSTSTSTTGTWSSGG